MNTNLELENACKEIIHYHGFSSNTVRGFSCYIADKPHFSQKEGLLLWSFSKTYKRIETQVQKYSSKARILRMEEMLGLSENEYARIFTENVQEYLSELRNIGIFNPIGSGVNLFGKVRVFNLGASLDDFYKYPELLMKFEEVTLKNPIVQFCENAGYFVCENKEELITKKYIED